MKDSRFSLSIIVDPLVFEGEHPGRIRFFVNSKYPCRAAAQPISSNVRKDFRSEESAFAHIDFVLRGTMFISHQPQGPVITKFLLGSAREGQDQFNQFLVFLSQRM